MYLTWENKEIKSITIQLYNWSEIRPGVEPGTTHLSFAVLAPNLVANHFNGFFSNLGNIEKNLLLYFWINIFWYQYLETINRPNLMHV